MHDYTTIIGVIELRADQQCYDTVQTGLGTSLSFCLIHPPVNCKGSISSQQRLVSAALFIPRYFWMKSFRSLLQEPYTRCHSMALFLNILSRITVSRK